MDGEHDTSRPASPLETFVRDYLEAAGGDWDEIEPQVYDVLLPSADGSADGSAGMLRLTFDPEALPDHPQAQLASFGTPLVDRLLESAVQRGRSAVFYLVGLNLTPHNLAGRISRQLSLAEPLELRLERVRALHFTQAVYWFQAEFVSDQKEREVLPVAIDLHSGREVRHRELLLDGSRWAEQPAQPLPEARRLSLAAGYALARDQVLRSVTPLAGVRARELAERRDQQLARMSRYYADLRAELTEQSRRPRGRSSEEGAERQAARLEAINREEQVRLAEVRQKTALHVHLRLLQVLRLQQPKLLVPATLLMKGQPCGRLELVWDPLTEALEPPSCPTCGRPTFALERLRTGQIVCPACVSKGPGRGGPSHR
jgi:hypothetical protein